MENKLIPLITAYKNCTAIEATTRLHADVMAGKIKTVELQGKIFVNENDIVEYYPDELKIKKATAEELEAWVKDVKMKCTFFKQNN